MVCAKGRTGIHNLCLQPCTFNQETILSKKKSLLRKIIEFPIYETDTAKRFHMTKEIAPDTNKNKRLKITGYELPIFRLETMTKFNK